MGKQNGKNSVFGYRFDEEWVIGGKDVVTNNNAH